MADPLQTQMFRNGPVSSRPAPPNLVSRTQHNASLPLLNVLPLEIRTMIFKEVLGNNEIDIMNYAEVKDGMGYGQKYTELDFALLLNCRQIYVEAKDLLYPTKDFVFYCRHYRDAWAVYRTPEQLAAVRMVKTPNAYIFDSINMSGMGGCQAWCENQCSGSLALTVPFSTLFPNLKRIGIVVSYAMHDCALEDIKYIAQEVGMSDWKDFVKMRERASVEVAVVVPMYDINHGLMTASGVQL